MVNKISISNGNVDICLKIKMKVKIRDINLGTITIYRCNLKPEIINILYGESVEWG